MIALGIETSCDETAVGIVRDGREVLANIVFSQVPLHRPYGGVVPEIASRNHVEKIPLVLAEAMQASGLDWDRIDTIAVTYGPGLATALLVGIATAKGLALRLKRPLVGINHLEAHLYSAFLSQPGTDPAALCPMVVLIVSGGHSLLLHMDAPGHYRLLGQTIDDAAGEAFDKGANLLGLGYPGGPAIDRASAGGDPCAVRFPRGLMRQSHGRIPAGGGPLAFSFSGLKTALLYHLKNHPLNGDVRRCADIAASYQEAIIDTLVERTDEALRTERALAVVGGVSLNRRLRARITTLAEQRGVPLLLAPPAFCMDNAAMVAALAGSNFPRPAADEDPMTLDAVPTLALV